MRSDAGSDQRCFSYRMFPMIAQRHAVVMALILAVLSLAWADEKKDKPPFKLTKEEQELIDATNAAQASDRTARIRAITTAWR